MDASIAENAPVESVPVENAPVENAPIENESMEVTNVVADEPQQNAGPSILSRLGPRKPKEEVVFKDRRLDCNSSIARRCDSLHVYGTDSMSTDNVMSVFKAYSPNSVEWVNLSSCNVVFPDASTAESAFIELTQELKSLQTSSSRNKDASLASEAIPSQDDDTPSDQNRVIPSKLSQQDEEQSRKFVLFTAWRSMFVDSSNQEMKMVNPSAPLPEGASVLSMPSKLTKLLVRYASVDDKRTRDAIPWRGRRRGKHRHHPYKMRV